MNWVAKPHERKPSLLRRGRFWAKAPDAAYALLWFEYLRLSPSYELARKKRAGSWTTADNLRKPDDFEDVLAVYDDLGDVHAVPFREWWLSSGIDYFGHRGNRPRVTRLGTFRHRQGRQAETLNVDALAYLEAEWQNQGEPTAMVVAIPVGLPKAQILKQVAALLENCPEKVCANTASGPKYSLLSRKLDSKSLFKYLMCLWVKGNFPKLPLWRLGAYAKISSTYSERLKSAPQTGGQQQTDDRNALKILTSRALSRGVLIAENAARGRFPTYAKNDYAIEPDWDHVRRAYKKRSELTRSA